MIGGFGYFIMPIFKKKEKSKTVGIEAKEIFDLFHEADIAHQEWDKRAQPDEAYNYFETNQLPSREEAGDSYWVQINRIREAHKTRMGILTSSAPKWTVSGRGKDSSDRQRIKLIRYMMIWMAKESRLHDELLDVLFNYSLVGMGWLRVRFDKQFVTKMDTIGMTVADSLDPRLCYPDNRARKTHSLDGRYCAYIHRVLKEEFADVWGQRLMPDGTKINVNKIFRDIDDKNHPDFKLNAGRSPSDKEITVIEWDYWRYVKKGGKVGKEVLTVPMKEYRVALAAGYQKLVDYISPVSDLNTWQKVLFSNDTMHDLPYSSADFQAEKELQDLSNIMISMTIDNMARQMNSPWAIHKGSVDNIPKMLKSASKAGGYLEWEYTREMKAAGILADAARPTRLPPGQVGADWLQTLMWVQNQFDRISVPSVLKGQSQPGVTSGKQAEIQVTQALQPSYYAKQKLEGPLSRVGEIYYHHAKTNITDEMELPVDDEGIDVDKGIVINRKVKPKELMSLVEAVKEHGDRAIVEFNEVKMYSIRQGDKRLSLGEWVEKGNSLADLSGAELIENDITFGNFNVALTVDPLADISKQERVEKAQVLAGLMIKLGAVKTGLKYMLESNEVPDRDKLMSDLEEELKQRQGAEEAQEGQVSPEGVQ